MNIFLLLFFYLASIIVAFLAYADYELIYGVSSWVGGITATLLWQRRAKVTANRTRRDNS